MGYYVNPDDNKTYFVPQSDVPEGGIKTVISVEKWYQGKAASDELIAYAAANPGKIRFDVVREYSEAWKRVPEEELMQILRKQGFDKI